MPSFCRRVAHYSQAVIDSLCLQYRHAGVELCVSRSSEHAGQSCFFLVINLLELGTFPTKERLSIDGVELGCSRGAARRV